MGSFVQQRWYWERGAGEFQWQVVKTVLCHFRDRLDTMHINIGCYHKMLYYTVYTQRGLVIITCFTFITTHNMTFYHMDCICVCIRAHVCACMCVCLCVCVGKRGNEWVSHWRHYIEMKVILKGKGNTDKAPQIENPLYCIDALRVLNYRLILLSHPTWEKADVKSVYFGTPLPVKLIYSWHWRTS